VTTMEGMPTRDVEQFEAERPRLLGLAYRLLSERSEAEDVVQDAWLAWSAADRDEIDRPEAWLTTVTSRIALDRMRSARHRHEEYVGPWLPEPTVQPPGTGDPEAHAELAESLTLGFLTMLESLAPLERVVFVLSDVYEVPFADIATMVGKSADACRQVASRARRRVREGRPRLDPPADANKVVAELLVAVATGDMDVVTSLLAPDVVLLSDGGPNRYAARRPVIGPDRVARLMVNLGKRVGDGRVEAAVVNGQPGVLFRDGQGRPFLLGEIEVADGMAWRIFFVLNPEKLTNVDIPADLL
jgi:RNA polymerase sigma-70 factor, ECF subfamily